MEIAFDRLSEKAAHLILPFSVFIGKISLLLNNIIYRIFYTNAHYTFKYNDAVSYTLEYNRSFKGFRGGKAQFFPEHCQYVL